MRHTDIIHDKFKRHHYRIHVIGDPPLHTDIQPVNFPTATMTENFVGRLDVYPGFWRRRVANCPLHGHDHNTFSNTDKGHASRLIFLGMIKLYPLTHLDGQTDDKPPVRFPSLPTVKGINYTLAPPSLLLTEPDPTVKTFSDRQQAARFLAELDIDQTQLNELATTMGIDTTTPTNPEPIKKIPETKEIQKSPAITPQITAMAQALTDKQFFLLEQPAKTTPPPPTTTEDAPDPRKNRKPPSLGAHEEDGTGSIMRETTAGLAAAVTSQNDTPPLCQRNSLTVSCSHGRSVTLGPDTQYMPNLDVIASSKKPDTITLTSDITDICPGHTPGHISIGREIVEVTHKQAGKCSTFRAYADTLDIRSNPVKYAWLPRIKPKTYPIYPGSTCDNSKLKNAGKGILLNVYPSVAWDWSVTLGYGANQHTYSEDKKSPGVYKKELNKKRFSINGHIKLTQNNEKTLELDSQFKNAIESTRQQIETVTNLVDSVISRFDEGKEPKVTITWPNLKLNLKTELAEGKDHYSTVAFDFGISAAPFFGLSVEVDILPVLAKPLDGGMISKWLIEEAQASLKKGIGNEKGLYSLKGEVSVIMKGSGTLACEAHFKGDFSNNNNRIEKVSGKPVEGKIEFSAEGKVDVKGHLLKIKVELVAGVGIKSGITLGLQIDSDDIGYYWQPETKFNGIKVYITKYVKVEKESGGEDDAASWGIENASNMSIKEITEHVWIEEKTLGTDKHYFIEY